MNRHTPRFLTASLVLTVLLGSLARPAAGDGETGLINGQVTYRGTTMLYVVYVPRNYTPDKRWPVILFLHGAYAEGKDGYVPLWETIPFPTAAGSLGVSVLQHPQRFPCLVIWPQMPYPSGWTGIMEDLALRTLDEVAGKYNGDRNRLYLTGLSKGGEGTWKLASDHPDLFAAAMPIAGAGTPNMVPALKSLPMWVFHGGNDGPGAARNMVAALKAAGNPNVQYTEYPGVGHNCWDLAYNDPKVIAWLLAQHR